MRQLHLPPGRTWLCMPCRRMRQLVEVGSNSCIQFPLEIVIQLLKVAGVDLPADTSTNASGNPSDATAPVVDNLDLVNMPATFDHEEDETSWQQVLPLGEVGPQLSDLELSESDSDSSAASILGVCLDGFDGDAWMSDVEGVQDEIQVGEAAGVNDRGDIPWRTTTWSTVAQQQSAKVAKNAAIHLGATVTLDLQEAVHSGIDANGEQMGGGGNKGGENVHRVNLPLTSAQVKEKKRLQMKNYRSPNHSGTTHTFGTSHHHRDRTTEQLAKLSKL